MQRQTQKPGCKEQKVFQLHILYSMASKEPDKELYTEKIKVGGCRPNTTVFSNKIIITEAHIRSQGQTVISTYRKHCTANISAAKTILSGIHPKQNPSSQ